MPDLIPILADFLATAQGAYPDLDVTEGSSCVLLRWGSHTLTAWVDVNDGTGMTITHNESEQDSDGGPDPLATVAELIVEHVTEGGYDAERGEAPEDANPGTFAARVWVELYGQRIERAKARIARLDPEGRYSVKESEPLPVGGGGFVRDPAIFDDDEILF